MTKSIETLRKEFLESNDLKFACIKNLDYGKRQVFLEVLKERATNPYSISQSNTPLCGPAAFLYCVATRRANTDDYERYVLELATTGVGWLGRLKVAPSRGCRNASLAVIAPRTKKEIEAIAPIDWIALASLRDTANPILNMNNPGSNMAGITLGNDMVNWFSKTGWYSGGVGNFSNPGFPKSLRHLFDINMRQNSDICLLIHAGGLDNPVPKSGPKKTWAGTANHWIVLSGRINRGNQTPICGNMPASQKDREKREQILRQERQIQQESQQDEYISFSYWTWRRGCRSLRKTTADFLPYYYGYVSATL